MTFQNVYAKGSNGIEKFDLKDGVYRAFAFDYEHSG